MHVALDILDSFTTKSRLRQIVVTRESNFDVSIYCCSYDNREVSVGGCLQLRVQDFPVGEYGPSPRIPFPPSLQGALTLSESPGGNCRNTILL